MRETIFSSEICSYEYDHDRIEQASTGNTGGTILFDDIGNIFYNEMKYFCKRMKYFLLLSKELLKTFF